MNEIKITNRFTVQCADKLSTGHNTLLDIITPLTEGKGFTRYLVVGSGSELNGTAPSSPLAVKETELVEFNTDPGRGDTYAVYSVRLTGAELPDGSTVSELGLSAEADGSTLINYAVLAAPVEKKSGSDLYVRIELRLTLTSEYARLTAGDNELVRAFLGMSDFASARFYIGYGNDFYPNEVIPRGNDLVYKWFKADVGVENGALVFSASCKYSIYELVLKMNDAPVLRAFYSSGTTVRSVTATARRNRSFELRFEHVVAVSSVKYLGVELDEYHVQPLYRYVTSVSCPQLIPYRLKKNSVISCDHTGTYMSVKTDKELTVYTSVGSEAVALYKASCSPELYRLACDGSVFMGGDELSVLMLEGESATLKCLDSYKNVTKLEVLYCCGRHRVAMLSDGNFIVAETDGETVTEQLRIDAVPDDFDFSIYDYYTFNYWSVSGDIYGAICPQGEIASIGEALRTAVSTEGRELIEVHGRYVRYYDTAKSKYYLCLYEYPTSNELRATDITEYVADLVLVWTPEGELRRIMSYYANNLMPFALDGSYSVTRGTSAALLGNYLLTTSADGRAATAYLSEWGKIVTCPTLNGGNVTHRSVYIKDPRTSSSSAANYKITLSLGGDEQ